MSSKPGVKLSLAAGFLLLPSAVFALEMEFYTWGGHGAVVNAFNKLALIFSDGGYKALFFSVIVLAIVLGGGAFVLRATTGAKVSPLAWTFPLLVGVVLYLGMVVPTGTLHLYDPTLNAYQAVGGIPDGIVAMAGVLNTVERGLVEIVSAAADPLGYQAQAGGVGFLGLFKAVANPVGTEDPLFDASVGKYLHDCVAFELMRPGTTLTVEELRRDTTDFRASLAKADSPAIYTVFYDDAAGTTMTCQNAWQNLLGYLNDPAHLESSLRALCAQTGFDPNVPAQYQQCRTSLAGAYSLLGVTGYGAADYLRQKYLSERLHEEFRGGETSSIANYQFLLGASGTMKSANEMLPILRAVMTAIAIGLIPFLALFIPTPLVGKALGVIAGFFIWLTSWGVTDAIVHQFIIDFANHAYEQIRLQGSGLGMDAFYFAPEETFKILGMFGTIRMSGLMLATVITGMLIRFGGHALASLAGSVTGQIQSAGARAAGMVEDPAGRAGALKSNAWALPTEALANDPRWGYRGMSTESYVGQTWGMAGAEARLQNMGALQRQGVLPQAEGMRGLGEFARQSQAMDKVTTGDGILGYGSTPGGIVSSDLRSDHTAFGTTSLGWQRQDNLQRDEAGNEVGTRTLTGAAGQLKFITRNGASELAFVQINGLSGKFGQNYQEATIRKGARSLSAEQNWGRMWQKVEEDSLSSSEANNFKEAVSNATAEEATRQVADSSAFSMVKEETKNKILEASVAMGLSGGGLLKALSLGSVSINAMGTGKYQLLGKDNKSVSFNATETEMQGFRQAISSIRETALTRALQTNEGLKYVSGISSQETGREAYSFIQEAATRDVTSRTAELEMMTAYLKYRAHRKYGMAQENTLQQTMQDINSEYQGSSTNQDLLNSDVQKFIMERYNSLDQNQTSKELATTFKSVEQGHKNLRLDANIAAADAEEKTADNSYFIPSESLKNPFNQVRDKGDSRRGANEQIWEDNGAFDFSSNPLKATGRDLGRIFIPQPDEPDARNLAGTPRDISYEHLKWTSSIEENPNLNMSDSGDFVKLEEMLRKLNQ